MSLLQTLGTGQGYLKAGFLGFAKSGKTYTASLLAVAVKRMLGLKGPIAFFDTEGGSEYVSRLIFELTGENPIGVRSRAFGDLMTVTHECEKAGVACLMVDSITHVWRELCDAYLVQVNDQRSARGWQPRTRLEFQDWGPIKAKWGEWTDWYLNSRMHVIILGRAGFEYDMQANENGKKELVKTGVKMKVETEFGFEPALLVEMERDQTNNGSVEIQQHAVVLGDRFGEITGRTGKFFQRKTREEELNEVRAFFLPHLQRLKPGAHAGIDTSVKTDVGVNPDGDEEWAAEKKQRTILCEEIVGELTAKWPGQTAAEKKSKAEALDRIFKTKSWTKVESMHSGKLREGLRLLRQDLNPKPPEPHTNGASEPPRGQDGGAGTAATPEQCAKLRELLTAHGVDIEASLADYNVTTLEQLTAADADEWLARLTPRRMQAAAP